MLEKCIPLKKITSDIPFVCQVLKMLLNTNYMVCLHTHIYICIYTHTYMHVLMSIYVDIMYLSFSVLPRSPYRTQLLGQLPSQDLKFNKLGGCFNESQQSDSETQRIKSGPMDQWALVSVILGDSRLTCTEAAAVPGLCSLRVFRKTTIVVDSWRCSRDRAQSARTLTGGKGVSLCVISKPASEY